MESMIKEIIGGIVNEIAIPIDSFSPELWQNLAQFLVDGEEYGCCECCCDTSLCCLPWCC